MLEDCLVKKLGKELDLIEKKDGTATFKNSRTGKYEDKPPKFPTI